MEDPSSAGLDAYPSGLPHSAHARLHDNDNDDDQDSNSNSNNATNASDATQTHTPVQFAPPAATAATAAGLARDASAAEGEDEDEDEDTERCRICGSPEEPETLIAPCLCSGGLALVHTDCLQRWIQTRPSLDADRDYAPPQLGSHSSEAGSRYVSTRDAAAAFAPYTADGVPRYPPLPPPSSNNNISNGSSANGSGGSPLSNVLSRLPASLRPAAADARSLCEVCHSPYQIRLKYVFALSWRRGLAPAAVAAAADVLALLVFAVCGLVWAVMLIAGAGQDFSSISDTAAGSDDDEKDKDRVTVTVRRLFAFGSPAADAALLAPPALAVAALAAAALPRALARWRVANCEVVLATREDYRAYQAQAQQQQLYLQQQQGLLRHGGSSSGVGVDSVGSGGGSDDTSGDVRLGEMGSSRGRNSTSALAGAHAGAGKGGLSAEQLRQREESAARARLQEQQREQERELRKQHKREKQQQQQQQQVQQG